MPEVQQMQQSGEMTQRFLTFVMMQAQQISLWLGLFPNPQTGQTETNLEAAKLFIDQLEMIREKTRGNLSQEESSVLNQVLSDLQLTYVRVSTGQPAVPDNPPEATGPANPSAAPETTAETPAEAESKKKFSKSYGS